MFEIYFSDLTKEAQLRFAREFDVCEMNLDDMPLAIYEGIGDDNE